MWDIGKQKVKNNQLNALNTSQKEGKKIIMGDNSVKHSAPNYCNVIINHTDCSI